jgi:hypothetical protein
MLTIEQLESCDNASQVEEFPQHMVEASVLGLTETFYPFGFPVTVMTNSADVLDQYREMWGWFERQQNTDPIIAEVQVIESESVECPPEPSYRIMNPFMLTVADRDNYGIVDLDSCRASITISTASLSRRLYAQYFLLGIPVCCISTRYSTPVHAGCVERNGHGVLLCGDSGAGKSTLSYACARSGWRYISDDASFLLNGGSERVVTGNCYQVRFRPSAADLFPELNGREITPRAAGKPSIELPTAPMPIERAQTARVDYIVFLNRRSNGAAELVPYGKDAARRFMRQVLFGSRETRIVQHRAIERLLEVEVLELCYTRLEDAIGLLGLMVADGK